MAGNVRDVAAWRRAMGFNGLVEAAQVRAKEGQIRGAVQLSGPQFSTNPELPRSDDAGME